MKVPYNVTHRPNFPNFLPKTSCRPKRPLKLLPGSSMSRQTLPSLQAPVVILPVQSFAPGLVLRTIVAELASGDPIGSHAERAVQNRSLSAQRKTAEAGGTRVIPDEHKLHQTEDGCTRQKGQYIVVITAVATAATSMPTPNFQTLVINSFAMPNNKKTVGRC